ASAAIECRVGDSLDADVEGGAQQDQRAPHPSTCCSSESVSVQVSAFVQQDGLDYRLEQRRPGGPVGPRTAGLPSQNEGSPGKPRGASQVLASVWNQTAEVDELLTSREFGRLPVSASAKILQPRCQHNGLLRVDHQADTRRNGNQPVQLPWAPSTVERQQGEVVGVAKHAEPLLPLTSTPRVAAAEKSVVVGRKSSPQHPVKHQARTETAPAYLPEALRRMSQRSPIGRPVLSQQRCRITVRIQHGLQPRKQHPVEQLRCTGLKADASMVFKPSGARLLWNSDDVPPCPFVGRRLNRRARGSSLLATSAATQGMRSASMHLRRLRRQRQTVWQRGWRRVDDGGEELAQLVPNARRGVSPARFSGLRRFRPVRALMADQATRPLASGPAQRQPEWRHRQPLVGAAVDSCQSCLCLAHLPSLPESGGRGSSCPDALPTVERCRLHHRIDCLLPRGSDCSAHFRILRNFHACRRQRGVKGASKATLARIGGSERAVVAPRWPLRRNGRADREARGRRAVLVSGCVPATRVLRRLRCKAAHEGLRTVIRPQCLRKRVLADTMSCLSRKSSQCLVLLFRVASRTATSRPTQDCVQVSEGDRSGMSDYALRLGGSGHSVSASGSAASASLAGESDLSDAMLSGGGGDSKRRQSKSKREKKRRTSGNKRNDKAKILKDALQFLRLHADETSFSTGDLDETVKPRFSPIRNCWAYIFAVDTPASIRSVSEEVSACLGHEPQALVGESFYSLVHPSERDQVATWCLKRSQSPDQSQIRDPLRPGAGPRPAAAAPAPEYCAVELVGFLRCQPATGPAIGAVVRRYAGNCQPPAELSLPAGPTFQPVPPADLETFFLPAFSSGRLKRDEPRRLGPCLPSRFGPGGDWLWLSMSATPTMPHVYGSADAPRLPADDAATGSAVAAAARFRCALRPHGAACPRLSAVPTELRREGGSIGTNDEPAKSNGPNNAASLRPAAAGSWQHVGLVRRASRSAPQQGGASTPSCARPLAASCQAAVRRNQEELEDVIRKLADLSAAATTPWRRLRPPRPAAHSATNDGADRMLLPRVTDC
uniref:PAS domain-containing protein n=1 Tax=Macrostomum lignano TaxID=282301 RepID=A0A1I8FID3_9PLAT